jgi:TolA-binding protein
MKSPAKITWALFIAVCMSAGRLNATGYYGPDNYLDQGGKNVDASPEFYWDLEVRRLAGEFHPAEKLPVSKKREQKTGEEENDDTTNKDATTEADLKDFDVALQQGKIKPPDTAKAKQQHKDARDALDSTFAGTFKPLPAEFDSEFADYHKGAAAYLTQQWDQARAAWEDLLKRPEQDRHYRTVWATFMLGKLALKTKDYQTATQWFQRTRELTRSGFADSLGLAAESYGWEGRSEWKQDHPEKAAALFLTQLALGDDSAVISLKALIPDREPVEGMLNYGPELEERGSWNDDQKRAEQEKELSKLKVAAQDALLRRLVTVHILATASTRDLYADETGNKSVNRCARWLSVISEVKPGQLDDAEYLGWVAYNNGDYKGAARWLEIAKKDAPASLWLKAKLQRRAGKLADAATTMAKAWEGVHDIKSYTGWTTESLEDAETRYRTSPEGLHWSFNESASGDLGALRLTRGDFVQAFDTFLKGGLWNDAAFVGERVLTANELKSYVDQQTEPESEGGKVEFEKLRYLLGRRLVREDRYEEATQYLRPPYDKILQRYAKALKDGADKKLSKDERARAWFTAAWLARFDGMELMGTEAAPDTFVENGELELADLAREFQSGKYQTVSYDKDGNEKKISSPIVLKPSKEELQRLAKNRITPNIRFHYRLIAGALAIRAAELLADNSEELADVVNTAGLWVKDRDEKTGNRYMQIIERRCSNTEIGRAAIAKHWFVSQQGPWSTAQQQAYEAMHKELKLDSPE